MNVKTAFVACINLLLADYAYSQSEPDLNELTVDRPGVADTPFTVEPGMYQFEVGFDYFSRYNGDLFNVPVAMFRTGISNSAELRVTTRNLLDHTEGKNFSGLSPLNVGVKVHIIEQNEWIPETDIMAGLSFPVNSNSTQPTRMGHDIYLLFQNDFYPNTAINYNVGLIWDGIRSTPFFSGSFCFNYLPTRRLGLFAEYFNYHNQALAWEHGMDGGLTYLLRPHFQVDLSGGASLIDGERNFFVSTGFALRLQKSHLRSKQAFY